MVCRTLTWLLAIGYAIALYLFGAGTWGWFGADRDPLAGIFLIPLGLPWNLFLDAFEDQTRTVLAALAPAVNLAILLAICSAVRRGRSPVEGIVTRGDVLAARAHRAC